MIGDDEKIGRCAELIQTTVDDELVMMDVSSGDCYGISGVGTRIWQLLDSNPYVCDIVSKICTEYDVAEDRCRRDVLEFLEHLKELKLVERR